MKETKLSQDHWDTVISMTNFLSWIWPGCEPLMMMIYHWLPQVKMTQALFFLQHKLLPNTWVTYRDGPQYQQLSACGNTVYVWPMKSFVTTDVIGQPSVLLISNWGLLQRWTSSFTFWQENILTIAELVSRCLQFYHQQSSDMALSYTMLCYVTWGTAGAKVSSVTRFEFLI